jgi:cell division protein FtsQ
LAVIDLGRKFLINEKGLIFKEMGAHDPTNLPVVHGLRFSDISIPDPPPTRRARSERVGSTGPRIPKSMLGSLYETVVAVLNLGLQYHGTFPDWTIKKIHVDRELGLTLVTADRQTAIKLGFNEFSAKYELLRKIIDFLNQGLVLKTRDVGSIDLKNLNRIVLNPIQKGGTRDG